MRRLSFLALGLVALFAAPAHAAPGDRQYVSLGSHDPREFLRAVRAGADFVRGGRGKQFRIILINRGVLLVIPGTSNVQRDYVQAARGAPGLQVIACGETIKALAQGNRKRIPTIPGVSVQPCAGLRDKMNVAGWQTAPGL